MSIVSMHDFYPDDIVRNIPQDLSPEQKAQVRENINAMSADTKIPTNLADMHEDENHQTVTTQEKKKWNENHGAGGLTPEQEAKLAEIDNKLDQAQLQNAINQALTEAQQSGLFDGQDGQTPNLTIGTVTTLEPGTLATASITGSVEALKLNLGIPKGASGKDGGYYTMSVTQPDPEHITVYYEPSKPDMPPVDDVTITLPKGSGGGGSTDISLGMTTAKVGQIAKIKAVDEIGKPTEWEPVDFPSGGGEKPWKTKSVITESPVANYTEKLDSDTHEIWVAVNVKDVKVQVVIAGPNGDTFSAWQSGYDTLNGYVRYYILAPNYGCVIGMTDIGSLRMTGPIFYGKVSEVQFHIRPQSGEIPAGSKIELLWR